MSFNATSQKTLNKQPARAKSARRCLHPEKAKNETQKQAHNFELVRTQHTLSCLSVFSSATMVALRTSRILISFLVAIVSGPRCVEAECFRPQHIPLTCFPRVSFDSCSKLATVFVESLPRASKRGQARYFVDTKRPKIQSRQSRSRNKRDARLKFSAGSGRIGVSSPMEPMHRRPLRQKGEAVQTLSPC